jgi:putative membrane protein
MMKQRDRVLIFLLSMIIVLLAGTAINPYDRTTWLMEVAPVLLVCPVLVLTYRRFPLTSLLYGLLFLHAIVLIVGGAYTYARVPLGFWMRDLFSFSRNNYDRIGHFLQGVVPALLMREVLLRKGYVSNPRMAAFLSLCTAMAISAWYELLEWAAAVSLGQGADAFLGTQGDPWDTQWDMFMCFSGAMVALVSLARAQDRQIKELNDTLE